MKQKIMPGNYEIEPEKMMIPKPGAHPPEGWIGTWTTPPPYLYLVVAPCIPETSAPLE